ncbi:MAG: hypothetical protein ABW213_03825 [Tardiphaga sp.]
MLANGRYSAWFRIPARPEQEGMGVIMLADGILEGSDGVIAYSGSYVQYGDAFTAKVATRRHTEGRPALFGIDEIDIELTGTSKNTTAACRGIVKQQPGLPLEVILLRMEG